jgi:hypothetical protein
MGSIAAVQAQHYRPAGSSRGHVPAGNEFVVTAN